MVNTVILNGNVETVEKQFTERGFMLMVGMTHIVDIMKFNKL